MEKDRRGRLLALIALLVGIAGLSIGFAAFSNTLSIKSDAEYLPSSDIFNVDFSSDALSIIDGNLEPKSLNPLENGPTGSNATISNLNDPTITGIKATFTEPGQSVIYEFYVRNVGEMEAFLRSVTFGNATPNAGVVDNVTTVGSGFKTCTQLSRDIEEPNPATVVTMEAACNGITLTLTLGEEDMTGGKVRANFNDTEKTAHDLAVTGSNVSEKIILTISYPTGSARADGDFTVNFGDITFVYASTANDS